MTEVSAQRPNRVAARKRVDELETTVAELVARLQRLEDLAGAAGLD